MTKWYVVLMVFMSSCCTKIDCGNGNEEPQIIIKISRDNVKGFTNKEIASLSRKTFDLSRRVQ